MSDISAIASDDELLGLWQRCGEWLSQRFEVVRVNSRNHLVVPGLGNTAFMLGFDRTNYGVIADLHVPFLVRVPDNPQLFEVVAMNQFTRAVVGFDVIGSVRTVPDEQGSSLELRQCLPADGLTQALLDWYVDCMTSIANRLHDVLRPAFGGVPLDQS